MKLSDFSVLKNVAARLFFARNLHACALTSSALFFSLTLSMHVRAAEEAGNVPDGPWISAVAWQNDTELVGARSDGLLFRPAAVVKASGSTPNEFSVVGESETSLWSVLPLKTGAVVASDYKGGVHLFGGSDGQGPKKFTVEARWIRALEHSPAEGEILAGTEDGKLLVLSVGEAKELRRVDAHASAIFDIAVSSAGDKIATSGGDGTIKIFSWPALEKLSEMHVNKEAVWSLAFVNNDTQIVSGGADRAIQLWDVASASSIITIGATHNWVTSLVALPKTSLVVAGCMDGNVVVADYQTMQTVSTSPGPGTAIWSIALSPDGKQLAVGTRKQGLAVMKVGPWKRAGRAAAEQAHAIRPPAPKKK